MAITSSTSPDAEQRANFATTARLLSCLVTESLVEAVYIPTPAQSTFNGWAIILASAVSLDSIMGKDLDSVLAAVPLHHRPVTKTDSTASSPAPIGLLDPMDMIQVIYEVASNHLTTHLPQTEVEKSLQDTIGQLGLALGGKLFVEGRTPSNIWKRFSTSINLDEKTSHEIEKEYNSSVHWQAQSYRNPASAPAFSSPSIDWEQSIVEGHPTHPMHKTRGFLPPLADEELSAYDFLHPRLRYVSLPSEQLKILYDFEKLTAPLLTQACEKAGTHVEAPSHHIVIPVHELQVAHIKDKFPDAFIFPESINTPLRAQQSLRSVVLPEFFGDLQLKLALGVKLTSAVRTISPESAYFGPHFSHRVVPVLTMNREVVTVAKELGSVVHSDERRDIAKHCAAIVRQCFENRSEERGERLIVCTSLVESGHAGTDGKTPSVVRVFNLDTEAKRLSWLRRFVSIFLQAFLPPMIHNGVAFECHPQNCVARFDIITKELKGFIIRDFGGLKIHPETLKATTGVSVDYVEGHSVISETLEDVYTRMYHTIIHNHFQQLVRVLGLHYNGKGWEIVREELRNNIPREHPLYDVWLAPERKTFPGKCFLRMRMVGAYRFHLHSPFPNLIHYTGVDTSAESL